MARIPHIHLVLLGPVPLLQPFPHQMSTFPATPLRYDLMSRFLKALPGFSQLSDSNHICSLLGILSHVCAGGSGPPSPGAS